MARPAVGNQLLRPLSECLPERFLGVYIRTDSGSPNHRAHSKSMKSTDGGRQCWRIQTLDLSILRPESIRFRSLDRPESWTSRRSRVQSLDVQTLDRVQTSRRQKVQSLDILVQTLDLDLSGSGLWTTVPQKLIQSRSREQDGPESGLSGPNFGPSNLSQRPQAVE
jgi:hypothetical protein